MGKGLTLLNGGFNNRKEISDILNDNLTALNGNIQAVENSIQQNQKNLAIMKNRRDLIKKILGELAGN